MSSSKRPIYQNGVLIGNWVEDNIECPKRGTFYFPPKEEIDYEKMKPESRQKDFRQFKLSGVQGNIWSVLKHDSHIGCGNYTSTNDLVYNHLPKPLCGPLNRRYRRATHHMDPQPDFTKCYGNLTEFGLKTYKESVWRCEMTGDRDNSTHLDTYVPPKPNEYLPRCERKARNSSFTRTFRFKMTKSKT